MTVTPFIPNPVKQGSGFPVEGLGKGDASGPVVARFETADPSAPVSAMPYRKHA